MAISVLVVLAGAIGMLLLLLVWFGGRTIVPEFDLDIDPINGARDPVAIYESQGPFIPMPEHLKTHDQMIAWMTQELPRLTADMTNPRA